MALNDIDFEGAAGQGQGSDATQKPDTSANQTVKEDDVTHLSGSEVDDLDGENNNAPKDDTVNNDDKTGNGNDNLSTGELNVGDQLEVDGVTYTVAKNGDLVDDKGNIFKESKDVADWLKSMNVENASDENITLDAIQKELGVTITDENGKAVEFTNDAAGVKSYVDSVITLRSKELQDAAINRLYQDNPMLKQFQDYVQVNGTPRGFGEIPDRSRVRLDKDNEAQLISVIKIAAEEFGNKSLNDNYIKYLRDSGGLYDEARAQLDALVDKDKAYRKQIETEAARQRQEEADNIKAYWENVNKMINGRVINGYKIPDSFTKEVDGKKVVVTPNDFFNYVSTAVEDENGNRSTAYQRDLAKLSDEDFMAREMLDAWLMFTGGTYKDLIDMAVKENEVRRLVIKSKQSRANKTVKIVKQQTGKTNIDDIIL